MTTTYTSRVPSVIDALLAAWRAVPGHYDPMADTPTERLVPVFDGPEYGITADRVVTWGAVGWAGDPDTEEDGGDADQNIAALGNRSRDEVGSIRCRIVSQTGDRAPIKAARDAAFAEFAVVENLCRTTPTLGANQGWMSHVEVTRGYRWRQEYREGPLVTIDFTVLFKARI
jgi:hypothetical protein